MKNFQNLIPRFFISSASFPVIGMSNFSDGQDATLSAVQMSDSLASCFSHATLC
jgi:hypothetical protein